MYIVRALAAIWLSVLLFGECDCTWRLVPASAPVSQVLGVNRRIGIGVLREKYLVIDTRAYIRNLHGSGAGFVTGT